MHNKAARWVQFLLFILLWETHALAEPGKLGVGFILGSPTAITVKSKLSKSNALDGGLGFYWDDSFLVYGDYLYLYPGSIRSDDSFAKSLVPYLGLGATMTLAQRHTDRYKDRHDHLVFLGMRIPFGISWQMPKQPFEVFLELVPVINVVPGLYFEGNGGLGFRFYF